MWRALCVGDLATNFLISGQCNTRVRELNCLLEGHLHLDAAFSRWHFAAVIETLEIERMSLAERLQAMELLWRSLSAKPEKLESPGWHKKILAKRLAKVEAGKGEFLTIAQLKKRLTKRAA